MEDGFYVRRTTTVRGVARSIFAILRKLCCNYAMEWGAAEDRELRRAAR